MKSKLNKLIQECIKEVIQEEYDKKLANENKLKSALIPLITEVLEEEGLMTEVYGGYQVVVYANRKAYLGHYPEMMKQLKSITSSPMAISLPIKKEQIRAIASPEQIQEISQSNAVEVDLDTVKNSGIKFKRLADPKQAKQSPEGPDMSVKDRVGGRVAMAGSVKL